MMETPKAFIIPQIKSWYSMNLIIQKFWADIDVQFCQGAQVDEDLMKKIKEFM